MKSVENEIEEWIVKFECLLSKLIWVESKVHFQTEYCSLQTISWQVDVSKYPVEHNGEFPKLIDKDFVKRESSWSLKDN